MDPNGRIYIAPQDEIPAEDKARLDGFLRGRAEADKAEIVAELEANLAEAEARARGRETYQRLKEINPDA